MLDADDAIQKPRILFAYLGEDDPTKSTMLKLKRFGLAEKTGIEKDITDAFPDYLLLMSS